VEVEVVAVGAGEARIAAGHAGVEVAHCMHALLSVVLDWIYIAV
jgi:hypothetical protein